MSSTRRRPPCVVVSLSAPAGSQGVQVDLTMSAGQGMVFGTGCTAGVDIRVGSIPPSGSVTFSSGETAEPAVFDVCGDLTIEADEIASVEVTRVTFAVVGDGQGVATISNDDDGNVPPTADAGPDQNVGSGRPITLDGTDSTDPENGPLTYLWAKIGGPAVVLRDETEAVAHVDGVDGPATLTFRLTVTDGNGHTDTDTVVVNVAAPK